MKKLIILSLSGFLAMSGYSTSHANQGSEDPQALDVAYEAASEKSNSGRFGVGAGFGTTGGVLEAKFAVTDAIMLRGNFNYLDFSLDEELDDIDYEGDFKANSFGVMVDLAPFKNGFVISGGAYIGDKELDLAATPTGNVEIGDEEFTAAEVGTLKGKAELKNFAPYLGIGYDGFMAGSKDWSFNARAGVMFTGSPKAELVSANGTLSNNQVLIDELNAEIQSVEDDLDDYKYYPVVSLGITRRF